MRRFASLVAGILILVVAAQAMVAFAALAASTNKSIYVPGDELVVSGSADPGAVIVIKLENPNGETVLIDQLKAGSDGSFTWSIRFPSQPTDTFPTGTYTILVKNADTGEVQLLQVELQAGGEITGKVVDENGNPVAGAEVYVCSDGEVVATATTGSDGTFAVYVAPGTYNVRVEKPNYLKTVKPNVTVELGQRVNLDEIQIVSIDAKFAELEQAISGLQEAVTQIADLASQVQQLQEELGNKADQAVVDQLADQVSRINKAITQLADQIKAVAEQLDIKADKTAVDQLAEQLDGLRSQLAELQAQVSSIQNQLAGKADQAVVDQLAAQINQVAGKVDQLAAKMSELETGLKQLQDKLSTLESRVNTLEAATQSIGQLQDAINKLQQSVDTFQQTASQLQTQVKDAADKAGSASSLAMVGLVAGIIGMIIAIVAAILVYRKIAA